MTRVTLLSGVGRGKDRAGQGRAAGEGRQGRREDIGEQLFPLASPHSPSHACLVSFLGGLH
jgi:hypothetical protein